PRQAVAIDRRSSLVRVAARPIGPARRLFRGPLLGQLAEFCGKIDDRVGGQAELPISPIRHPDGSGEAVAGPKHIKIVEFLVGTYNPGPVVDPLSVIVGEYPEKPTPRFRGRPQLK